MNNALFGLSQLCQLVGLLKKEVNFIDFIVFLYSRLTLAIMSHLQRIEELVEGLNKSTIESDPSIKNMGDTKEIAIEIGSEVMDYVSFKDIGTYSINLFSFY